MVKLNYKSFILALILVVIDRVLKIISINGYKIANFFVFVKNKGISWGLFNTMNSNNVLLIVTLLIVLGLIYFYKDFDYPVALNLIIIGGLSNIIDRIIYGYVVDFINLGFFPVFNLADFSISLGFALILIRVLKNHRLK